MTVRLHFHGAAGAVTGSCYRIETPEGDVLVDCGLFQGPKTLKELNYRPFPFSAGRVSAVLLTHAHVDHSGLLPKLMKAGFAGPIHSTEGTRELCAVMLPDAGGIQEHEVEQLNRRITRRGGRPVEPIYTADDAEVCMRLFSTIGYGEWVEVIDGLRARWWDAGHILGSASIEVEVIDRAGEPPLRLLFSGDVGQGGSDYAADPQGPAGIDHLIIESTYGAREHRVSGPTERRRLLAEEVQAARSAGGPLLIPAFAVERTQELISDLLDLMDDGVIPATPIFLDSPLAIRATRVFYRHGRDRRGRNPFEGMRSSKLLHTTETADESRALEKLEGWRIIIAASGMCDAGRVRHHLKRLLWRRDATVLLSGYQAIGTLGRILQDGARRVSIQGEPIRVAARIRSLDIYSAHADGPGLSAWARARGPVDGRIFLTHGEPEGRRALAVRLAQAGFEPARIDQPEIDDSFVLRGSQSQQTPRRAPRIAAGAATRLDWHNARAKLMLALNDVLEAAPDDAARSELLEALLDDMAAREPLAARVPASRPAG
jgi:metallo-beta-lactamase family protein